MKVKADKGIRQAESLLEVRLDDNPGLVMLAADALRDRQDMMAGSVRLGARRLAKDVQAGL